MQKPKPFLKRVRAGRPKKFIKKRPIKFIKKRK